MLNFDPLIVRIEGEGGRGGSSIGEILARSAARCGYNIQCSRAFPAEIKGGRAWFQVRVSSKPLGWWGGTPHLEMTDTKQGDWVVSAFAETAETKKSTFSPLSLAKAAGSARDSNLIALGYLAATLGLDIEIVVRTAADRYKRRGTELLDLRQRIEAGYKSCADDTDWVRWPVMAPEYKDERLVINGNEAIALGALAAGVKFFAGYPITPASSILEMMLAELPKLGGTALQLEDEMAALAACLGASYAGKRAMAATSGPGFALMSELMNLAVNAEIPITVVDVQRSGPATGQPSKSEQADLMYAIYGSPGDSPRIVMAPSDVNEALQMTVQAVNLAEHYQMPVLLLSDGALSNRIEAIPMPDWDAIPIRERRKPPHDATHLDFQRFLEESHDGVSAMSTPGEDDLPYIAGGMEHGSAGNPSATVEDHRGMALKKLRKLTAAGVEFAETPGFDSLTPTTKIGVVGWGSTRGAIEEGVARLRVRGIQVATAHVRYLNPLPEAQLAAWMRSLDRVIVAEENNSGQLAQLIRHIAPDKIESLLPGETFEVTPELVEDYIGEKAVKEKSWVKV